MGWKKVEAPTYPALGYELGKFIRGKSRMNDSQSKVDNTMYYENGKVQRNYEYCPKTRLFQTDGSVYTKLTPEEVKAEIEALEIEEALEEIYAKQERNEELTEEELDALQLEFEKGISKGEMEVFDSLEEVEETEEQKEVE